MHNGVESRTVLATREVPTPESSVTESPAVSTVRSYFPAPFVASVLNGSFVVFNEPFGV
ncbi:hypothetical protein HanRHA438_Chr17g0829441 [Helianthus annuus]|nr:hypothetical protein HanRHA438_Chr17g0829441 [Helianthus annuus]